MKAHQLSLFGDQKTLIKRGNKKVKTINKKNKKTLEKLGKFI